MTEETDSLKKETIHTRCFVCGAELQNPKYIIDELEFNINDHRPIAVCDKHCYAGSKSKLEAIGWDTTVFTETYIHIFIKENK